MFKIDQVEFQGYESVKMENADLSLYVTVSAGPRILGCSFQGGQNLFAVHGESNPFPYPEGGTYYVRGGHRLWYAPESAGFTYVPDNAPVSWQENPDGISLMQDVDGPTGIQKMMQIVMEPEAARVTVHHTLTNTGNAAVELAPWAITQMQPGGVAILPQNRALADEEGFWANRPISMWPYAGFNDPHVTWGDRFIFLDATYTEGQFKLGWLNLNEWLGYVLGDTLFVKSAVCDPAAEYFDFQASSQCYCNPRVLELETLGPRVLLQAGGSVSHDERWEVFGGVDFSTDEDPMDELAASLGLGTSR